MKKKLTIAFVAITASTINSFMLKNINKLSNAYNILIFCNDVSLIKRKIPKNVSLIKINFKRKLNLTHDLVSFFKLLYFFIKYKPNLTISITPKAGLLTALSSYLAKVSYRIHYFTGQTWVTKKGLVRSVYKMSDRIIFNFSHHVLVDSFSQKTFLVSNNVISKKKSTVLLHGSVGGVDIKKFKYKKTNRNLLRKKLQILNNEFVFLYLGRMNKDKGVIDLIEAFKKIEKNYKIFLILVGPIEDYRIKRFTKKSKKIIFIGTTSNPEQWFSMADLLCLPSYREGFGSVVIEAGSCNLPSLGSRIYGINDAIVENKTGFLHKVGNISDIKKKMIFAIKNKKNLKIYGERARRRVEKKFEENLISQEFFKFINSRINLKNN